MPMIQIDLQPLIEEQRDQLRRRVAAAVSASIGVPYSYVSLAIREWPAENLVEAGGWGRYDRRVLLGEAHVQAAHPSESGR